MYKDYKVFFLIITEPHSNYVWMALKVITLKGKIRQVSSFKLDKNLTPLDTRMMVIKECDKIRLMINKLFLSGFLIGQ